MVVDEWVMKAKPFFLLKDYMTLEYALHRNKLLIIEHFGSIEVKEEVF